MSDQTQPKLSLEEELDVLEAVYKVGKEKGLDLLRPEQVKKLKDAGRMGTNSSNEKKIKLGSDEAVLMIRRSLDGAVGKMLSSVGYCTTQEWKEKDWPTKIALMKLVLYMRFGIVLDDIELEVSKLFGGGK